MDYQRIADARQEIHSILLGNVVILPSEYNLLRYEE